MTLLNQPTPPKSKDEIDDASFLRCVEVAAEQNQILLNEYLAIFRKYPTFPRGRHLKAIHKVAFYVKPADTAKEKN
tara:strand:+ start:422 stop:649 length:228 start_codon:yes stop_codon:yes gene_type:complete